MKIKEYWSIVFVFLSFSTIFAEVNFFALNLSGEAVEWQITGEGEERLNGIALDAYEAILLNQEIPAGNYFLSFRGDGENWLRIGDEAGNPELFTIMKGSSYCLYLDPRRIPKLLEFQDSSVGMEEDGARLVIINESGRGIREVRITSDFEGEKDAFLLEEYEKGVLGKIYSVSPGDWSVFWEWEGEEEYYFALPEEDQKRKKVISFREEGWYLLVFYCLEDNPFPVVDLLQL